MDISERKKRILRAIIERYVQTAEPVGSKAIASVEGLKLSPATIRNEMSELELMGLLEQPHTSAGRIPTALGYRVYVNELMERQRLSIEETEAINCALRARVQQLDKLLADAGRLTSQLTSYPAYALAAAPASATISRFDLIFVDANTFIIVVMLGGGTVKNKLIHLPAAVEQQQLQKLATAFNASFTGISESQITTALITATERALGDTQGLVAVVAGFAIELLMSAGVRESYVAGASHIFEHPEFRDVDKAQKLLSYLSDTETLLKLPAPESGDMKIMIGPENLAEELHDSSVVVAKYDAGDDMQGLIGVVGPTRMDYSKVAARLSYIAKGLSWLFTGGQSPPGIDDGDGKFK